MIMQGSIENTRSSCSTLGDPQNLQPGLDEAFCRSQVDTVARTIAAKAYTGEIGDGEMLCHVWSAQPAFDCQGLLADKSDNANKVSFLQESYSSIQLQM